MLMVAIAKLWSRRFKPATWRKRYAFWNTPDRSSALHVVRICGGPITNQAPPHWICSRRQKREHSQTSDCSRYLRIDGGLYGSRLPGNADEHDVRVARYGGSVPENREVPGRNSFGQGSHGHGSRTNDHG